jgi:hypothetical protein
MEVVVQIIDRFGVQFLGWGISLYLAWRFFSKWDENVDELKNNVTGLTQMVKLQQQQLDRNEDDKKEIKEDIKGLQAAVFIVKYEKPDTG